MSKQEFLAQLQNGLSGLPKDDIEERLTFYSEMLDDRIEEGFSEDDAISAIGDVDEIVAETVADIPLAKIAKESIRPKRGLKVWEIVLLVLSSPIWLSLGFAVAAVIFALYVSLFAVIVSLWAVFASLAVCAVGGILAGAVFIIGGRGTSGVVAVAAGLICSGLFVFMFYGCRSVTNGAFILTKKIAILTKKCFIKRGRE